MTKTEQALTWTIQRMLEGRKWAYLWTFTFPTVNPVKLSSAMWGQAQKDLVRYLGFGGCRVYELHPGGHGLHIHVVTDRRFPVRSVRSIVEARGLGRIDVVAIPALAADYVCKYVSKSKRCGDLKGRRLWAAVGFVRPVASRVRDIEVDSPLSRLTRECHAILGGLLYDLEFVKPRRRWWAAYRAACGVYWQRLTVEESCRRLVIGEFEKNTLNERCSAFPAYVPPVVVKASSAAVPAVVVQGDLFKPFQRQKKPVPVAVVSRAQRQFDRAKETRDMIARFNQRTLTASGVYV